MKKSFFIGALIITSVLTLFMGVLIAGSVESSTTFQKGSSSNPYGDLVSVSGKVVESMDVGSYTYVSVEKGEKKTWVAIPQSKVVKGQEATFYPGAVMENFSSRTLDRTFKTIIFSRGIMPESEITPHAGSSMKAEAPKLVDAGSNIDKAKGSDAFTIAELYENSAALDGKTVSVRGKVVKFSPQIMGKNWIHIQDGSGDASKGTHDVTVTSKDVISQGDVVTVQGTLRMDKDFGSGYRFAVIVEEASIKE